MVRHQAEIGPALEQAFRYDKRVLAERFVKGAEITVGVVNGEVLPVVEVRPMSGFYDFEAKYTKGMTEYIVPAPLTAEAERRGEGQRPQGI